MRYGFLLRAVATSLVGVGMTCSAAQAQVRPEDQAAARALFEQGRKLVARKSYGQACAKFEESQKLDPGVGTLFHLADCYEQEGRTASAWAMFLDVAQQSAANKRSEREKAARDRAAAIFPNLAQITIVVDTSSAIDGLVVRRDGTEVGRGTWGTPVPVDPGEHQIEATAPGRETWSTKAQVTKGPGNTEVKVPVLKVPEVQAAAPLVSTHVEPAAPKGATRSTVGLVVGGAGIVAFGASVALSLHAKSKYNDAAPSCAGSTCDQDGADLRHAAVREGNIATVVGAVGLAAVAAGVVLFVTAPSRKSPKRGAEVTTAVGIGPSGLLLRGVW
ncbi:MAG TPA: hypothetical protein PLI95_06775 [Polyangiaceae bacterium]|nr:hypothetical protein [Polyangiaceae bacterium]